MTSPTTSTRAALMRASGTTGMSAGLDDAVSVAVEFDMGTSYCVIVDAQFGHRFRFIQIAAIEDHRQLQRALQVPEIRTLELLPFRHDDQRVRAPQRLVLRADEMQPLHVLRTIREVEREHAL